MSIKQIVFPTTGLADASPKLLYIDTDDTLSEVTATGYLNQAKAIYGNIFSNKQMAVVYTTDQGSVIFKVVISADGTDATLESSAEAGLITLPTVTNQMVYATNTTGGLAALGITRIFNAGGIDAGLSGTAGTLRSYAATASRGYFEIAATANTGNTAFVLTNAAQAAARTITIPDGGQTASSVLLTNNATVQTIATGGLAVALGALASGSTAGGFAGLMTLYSTTAANGSLRFLAVGNAGNFATTVSDISTLGQAQTVTIPDAGAATAQFLLNTGSANIIAKQQIVGLEGVLTFGTGTWTTTRIAQGNYVSRHTPGDETSIIGIDITPQVVVAASKGFRLDSFDVIYAIAANALDAQSVTLNRIVYANNVAVSSTAVAVTGALATAVQANPYVTNVVVDAPAFLITADSKYVLELTVDNAAASEYDYYGVNLRFSETIA